MATQVDLRHLRAFVVLADELHFTRSAARLHMTQQSLSTHIRQFEVSIGTTLFHRTTRSVELTAAGELLLKRVRPILEELEVAIEDVRKAGTGKAGQLRIGYAPNVNGSLMPAVFARSQESLPELKLLGRESWTQDAVDSVLHGRLDVALVTCAQQDSRLEVNPVRQEPLGAIVVNDSLAGPEGVIPVQRLANLTLIIWPREIAPGLYDRIFELFPHHAKRGTVYEMTNYTREGFGRDHKARTMLSRGEAFYAAPPPPAQFLKREYRWFPVSPATPVNIDLVWLKPVRLPALTTFGKLVAEVAKEPVADARHHASIAG